MAGQNERSSPVVMQYVNGETKIAWPTAIKTADPVLPLPEGPRLRALMRNPSGGRQSAPPIRLIAIATARDASVALLAVSGLTKTFGGFTAVSNVSFDVDEGEILGLIGPNGSGKSTIFNCIAGMYAPTAGSISVRGRGDRRPAAEPRLPQGHRPHLPDPAPVPQPDAARERRAVGLVRPGRGKIERAACWRQAEEALALVGLPTDARTTTDGLGAAALKKLELARALATQPQAAAGRREPQRPRSFRDGAGRRHAAAHPRARRASPSSGSSTSWAC